MAGPPRSGGLAPRLPSAFPGPRGESEEGAAGQHVGPYALPIAGLPGPPLCPDRAAGQERCRSLDGMWRGGQGGRAERRCKGRGRSRGLREGPARPAAGAAPFPHRRGRGRAGAAAASDCAGASARAMALCKGEGTGTGRAVGPDRGPQERPGAPVSP